MKKLSTWMAVGLAMAGTSLNLNGQTDERKQEIVSAVGEQAGDALFSLHQAVNAVADGWVNKTFEEKQALELAASYRDSAELVERLVKGKSDEMEKVTGLLVKQVTALEAWITIGDDALAGTYKKLKAEVDAGLAGGGGLGAQMGAAVAQGETIELKIVKSVAPNGKAGQPGTMTVTRTSKELPLEVMWKYANGGSDRGLCVPFPRSGKMAVFFGEGVHSVSIYKREGKSVTGRWVSTKPGSTLKDIKLTQGASKSEYDIEGGGRMKLDLREGMIANVTWEFQAGKVPGIAVGDNEYLALISMDPKKKAGVALYTMADDAKSATSRWTMAGANGAGEEELVVTAMSPGFLSGPPPAAAAGPMEEAPGAEEGSVEDEIKEVALKLLADMGTLDELRPTGEQLAAIAVSAEDAQLLSVYVKSVYEGLARGNRVAGAKQTEVKVGGPDWKDLAGGYSDVRDRFKPEVKIYEFSYVEPGNDVGMRYDGLIKVEGKWVFIPKAWRAFR
ncbi:hypothetical protein FEM03_20810 [Phragmitibacter flavus]|uniref:Uncharacterized protein n=1 Tax=Phragmitibacter flavus TaxID=2576071 RepID=A0A5R8K8Y9_9BACT|nr:hypothetical protein [Phragmitibacter flavus]TLD68778.1 hypothetical protein FEM03_20810 [Phragmitibacter flavus]